jgi:hypothetical protein
LAHVPAEIERLSAGQQASTYISIPSPVDGVVTARGVNLGQVVTLGQDLFTVTDLSTVWVEGSLLEDDFSVVREGIGAHTLWMGSDIAMNGLYQGAGAYPVPQRPNQVLANTAAPNQGQSCTPALCVSYFAHLRLVEQVQKRQRYSPTALARAAVGGFAAPQREQTSSIQLCSVRHCLALNCPVEDFGDGFSPVVGLRINGTRDSLSFNRRRSLGMCRTATL